VAGAMAAPQQLIVKLAGAVAAGSLDCM
jgi:hypothetical protein